MSPEIIIALISSITSIIVAVIQFRKPGKKQPATTTEPKRNWLIIGVLILLNIITVAAAFAWYYTGLVDIGGGAREYQQLIDEAKKENKPYVLESVVAHVKIIDSLRQDSGIRKAEIRIVYVIRPLKTIKDNDGAFVEEFRLNPFKIPFHWYGTNIEERGNDISNTYTVDMSGNKGQVITLLTGATYKYPLPMNSGRVITDGVSRLGDREDYYMYLNTGDYIGNLVIVIESPTTKLNQVERGAFKQEANKPAERKETFFGGKYNSRPEEISISYKWDNLRPGQSGGIIYSW